ncbi:hypothetical protein VNI00_002860 [Paramarasmius palmivorus]|uniref:Major facilitator superfamily (MFS) profile domain-containing protein n=1 Tax=Paramarasmius palmivorus TaxID=297713 RepID=A0AAW0DYG0_9AGAR
MSSNNMGTEKADEIRIEDASVAEPGERVIVTDEDSRRIVRKTDLHLLSILTWVYFLQILDKVVIGYSAVFGLKEDTNLVGNQYSSVGSVGYYAQMAAQPIGAYVLVKYPVKVVMPVIVFFWGCALCGMAGARNFAGLMAGRFFLGFFEALCIPLFSMITSSWYRRAEQPMRVATWYSTNGIASILGSALAYGLSYIETDKLHNYQILFMITGLTTVITGPILYFILDNSPGEARFLTPEDRLKAVERLRSNNTGIVNHKFKWRQVLEMFTELRGLLFFAMVTIVNMGASTSTVFGPLILKGLAGFDSRTTMLLNMPFGALQFVIIMFASWVATRFKTRSIILASAMAPVVAGVAVLYAIPREKSYQGQSKKAAYMASYNFASSFAHIFNPYLFHEKDAPGYIPGLRSVMICFCVLILTIGLTAANLAWLNKKKEKQRVANGKPAKIKDMSMARKFDNKETVDNQKLGENAFLDMTDRENDEFIYVL